MRAAGARRAMLLAGAVMAVLLVLPATAFGARFGAKLTGSSGNALEPSNSVSNGKGKACDSSPPADPCTRVAVNFENPVNGNKSSPVTGTIDKIRLIAGKVGKFRLQLARAKNIGGSGGDAKVVRQGPLIEYQGNGFDPNPNNRIEVFNVNLHVNQGDYLAIKMTRTSALRCNSGGIRQLLFQPPLPVGGSFQTTNRKDGCTLMVQAVI